MKKIIIFIIINLLLIINTYADVFYCEDRRSAGFEESKTDSSGSIVNFYPEKFKIKFDDSSNSLKKVDSDGYESTYKTYNKYKMFYVDNFDDTIVFQPKKWENNENIRHYVRSHTLPNDSLYIAQGSCNKF